MGRSWHRFLLTVLCAGPALACQRVPLCPDVHFDQDIAVPATDTPLFSSVDRFSAQTVPGPRGIAVSIVDGRGTIAFEDRGPMSAFIYGRQSFSGTERILYAGLGVEDGAWFPFWLYCTADGRLTDFYGEMTDRDVGVLERIEGTCSPTGDFRQTRLELPAHTLRNIALTCGFSATDSPGALPFDLAGSRAGTVTLEGTPWTVLPFHTVDCRTGCGYLSWYEIHAIISNQATQEIGFTIFYFDKLGVNVSNGLLLPSTTVPNDRFPNALWTLDR